MFVAGDIKYKQINCETALHQLKKRFTYRWDLNIYRGCDMAVNTVTHFILMTILYL